jgi:hypothetical protein
MRPTDIIARFTNEERTRTFELQRNGQLRETRRGHASDMWSPPETVATLSSFDGTTVRFLSDDQYRRGTDRLLHTIETAGDAPALAGPYRGDESESELCADTARWIAQRVNQPKSAGINASNVTPRGDVGFYVETPTGEYLVSVTRA